MNTEITLCGWCIIVGVCVCVHICVCVWLVGGKRVPSTGNGQYSYQPHASRTASSTTPTASAESNMQNTTTYVHCCVYVSSSANFCRQQSTGELMEFLTSSTYNGKTIIIMVDGQLMRDAASRCECVLAIIPRRNHGTCALRRCGYLGETLLIGYRYWCTEEAFMQGRREGWGRRHGGKSYE